MKRNPQQGKIVKEECCEKGIHDHNTLRQMQTCAPSDSLKLSLVGSLSRRIFQDKANHFRGSRTPPKISSIIK